MEKCYQPIYYHDDGTNLEYCGMPEELAENMAFPTRDDCERWLGDNDYDPGDYAVIETDRNNIEDLILVGWDGNFLDGTSSVSCFNTGLELDRLQGQLKDLIQMRMSDGRERVYIDAVTLYENRHDILENHGYNPDLTDDERHERAVIVAVDLEHAYDEDGTVYPLWDIVDLDDIELLIDWLL